MIGFFTFFYLNSCKSQWSQMTVGRKSKFIQLSFKTETQKNPKCTVLLPNKLLICDSFRITLIVFLDNTDNILAF